MTAATVPHPATEQLLVKAGALGSDLKEIAMLSPEAAREQYMEAKALASRAGEKIVKAKDGVENYVREHPLQSIMVAAGAGVLIGMLISRKR